MHVLTSVDSERIARLRAQDEFFWIDLSSPADEEVERLGEALDLHPVALEDTREFGQRPKIDPYEDHLLIVFFTARVPAQALEVHIYVSGGFIATVRRDRCDALDDLHDALADEPTDDEEALVYRVFDELTDAFFPVIDALEVEIDELEADVLARPRREQLTRSYRLRQRVRELLRLANAQRDHFRSEHEAMLALEGFERGAHPYLRDVGDHLVQVAAEFQRQSDDLVSITQTYFNANSDRLNATATRLTVGGTLFVVWTVITGFFGQNFSWLVDHIDSGHAFLFWGVGALVVPTVILLTLFWVKRHDWF
ncbi:MAG TPA: magnesium transporter CorA family protein [Solirubrobacter sp.]|nr:magnesium transporter CorA family protein [Solirubrobacter sp.]